MKDDQGFFREHVPPIRGVEECHECKTKTVRDIFTIPKEHRVKGEGGLLEAIACMECKIIYERLDLEGDWRGENE